MALNRLRLSNHVPNLLPCAGENGSSSFFRVEHDNAAAGATGSSQINPTLAGCLDELAFAHGFPLLFQRVENVSWLNPLKAQVFATTRWSVVKACHHASEAHAREALAELCQSYWQPVYACIRHHGYSAHDAQDHTQDFFVQLLGGKYLEHLDQTKGRFRAYLSVALQNFLHDRWRRRWTWRRGRGATVFSLDALEAENNYVPVQATHVTPASVYERQWARTVVKHALEQLKIELLADGKEQLFDHFDALMAGDTPNFPYLDVANALNMTAGALHAALHRWRRRFQILVREEIARTVLAKSDIEAEMRHLLRIFAQDE